VTPETADYLAKAREFLAKAQDMLAHDWPDEAARAAYLASFHAAQAFVLVRTGQVAKRHAGLRTVFAQLARNEPRIDRKFTRLLARGYAFKEVADYAVGPRAVVTAAEAREMIDTAAQFVDRVAEILA
jgi:uncharacterized protein (UPF0332 family)